LINSIDQISIVYTDVENIEPITKNEILEFFNQYIHPFSSTRAKVSIHLIAQASTGPSATEENSAAAEENPDASVLRAEQDVVVNGHQPSVSGVKMPFKIENVKAWKAGLQLSAAATPMKSLTNSKSLDRSYKGPFGWSYSFI